MVLLDRAGDNSGNGKSSAPTVDLGSVDDESLGRIIPPYVLPKL